MSLRKTLCCFVPAKKKSYSGHLYHKVDQNMLARSDEKKWQESKWRDDERNGERSDEKRHREGYSDEKRHREGYNDEQRHREQAKHYRGPHDDDKRHFERNDDYRRSSRSAKWHDEGNFHSQRSDGDRFERNNDKRSSRRSNSRPFVEREPQIISTSSEALLEIDDVGYAKILKPPKTPKVGLRSHGIDSDSTWKKEHGIEGTLKKDSRDNGTMSRGYGTKEDGKFRMNESTKDDSTLKRETLERSAQKPVDSTVISTQPREYRTKLPEAPELPQPRLKPNSDEDEMAMIARVKPYQASKDENPHSHYQFEDVTDDPKYQEKKLPDLEGALVEYCRIDHNKQKPQPQVLQSHTVVSARSQVDSFGGSPKARPQAAIWAADRKLMAHIIDVDVGQPCSNSAKCQCYGFRPHPWRKVCVHCKCDRNEHDVDSNKVLTVYERLGIKPKEGVAMPQKNNEIGTAGHGYTWVPPGLPRVKVEEYMNKLPNHVVPRVNSAGEKYREKQLMVQLPRQDLSVSYCKHLRTAVERRIYDEFVNSRNEVALDIGYVNATLTATTECRKCKGILEKGTMAVISPKLGDDAGWHPACFSCETCEQLLVDLTYCAREDKIYCERHYAELHKPRCSACDELIFAGEYTKAMNKDWHSDHFCCWQCDVTLTGQRYILRDEHPYCIKCYEEVFANTCDECSKAIGIDSKDLSYKDKHWHEECFLCSMCRFSLVDQPFGSKNEKIFCSNCYDQAFATRCDGCNEIFRAGMKKMEYKGKQWHDKCFCCAMCKTPIGTRSFIPKNDEVFCSNCYEEKFATRCCKCKKVINSGGVTYKNEPWHRECFCCTNCDASLAGQRFTSKDDKPYCANCYGELFAKRCSACVKPITGIGGAKFISFEDRHWHNDCFICAQCTASLVGKGFITDGADILCPECAKARLMAANA